MSWEVSVIAPTGIAAIVFAFFGMKIAQENFYLRILFMMSSVLLLLTDVAMAAKIADANVANVNLGNIPVMSMSIVGGIFAITLAIIGIKFLMEILKKGGFIKDIDEDK